MIITQEVNMFREAARHLWNTYLKTDADWNTVEVFREICTMLFSAQIITRLGINYPSIPVDTEGEYLSQYKIFMEGNGKLPLSVNRNLSPSGSWDYPVDWIPPEKNLDIRPICFFDFDLLGWRMFEYYRARIIECESHPELIGRDALIRCDHVSIEAEAIPR